MQCLKQPECPVQIAGDQSEPGYGPGEKGTVFKSRTGVWGAVPVVSDACGGGHAKGPFRDRAVQDLCAVLSEGGRRSGKELFSVDRGEPCREFPADGECVDPAGCAGAFVLPARILPAGEGRTVCV